MMALLNSPRGRPRFVALAVAIVLVYALLLPAYGPLVSPTFAEFLPNHMHVHLDGDSAHLHGYETLDGTSEGFVALPSADGSSAPGIVAAALTALLALASAPIVMLVAGRPTAPPGGMRTPTATPPPRAMLFS